MYFGGLAAILVATAGVVGAAVRVRSPHEPTLNRQELSNFKDLQYYAEISVGTPAQKFNGVVDTGSFELVLFSKLCEDCGSATAYDGQGSASHRAGTLSNSLSYGSGDVQANQSWDMVSIGTFQPREQCFWEGLSASMPILANANFQSIIGIGPPETPAADAWSFARNSMAHIGRRLRRHPGEPVPDYLVSQANQEFSMALHMSEARPLLTNFEVRMFSICLGHRPGSSGVLVWNDTTALQQPELFRRLPVVGKRTWTVRMAGVHLAERSPVPAEDESVVLPGCPNGCSAIIDSGTSLLVMPTETIDAFTHLLNSRIGPNCSNLHQLPDIIFSFDGLQVSLPPDAYMGQVSGSLPAYIEDVVRIRHLKVDSRGGGTQCEVAVMESFTQTEHGPLWILGMPFFRKYYTTFDLGSSMAERAIHVAFASEACTPVRPEAPLAMDDRSLLMQRREIDLSHVLPPTILRKAPQRSFLRV